MIVIGPNPEEQLTAFARSWFKLLAQGDWGAALGLLDEPNSYGIRWTKDSVVALVEDTFGPHTGFAQEFGQPAFSDPDEALGRLHRCFGALRAGGFWLDHGVSLNGVFS